MLLGLAPPARMTFLSADVDSVVGMRKMKTALVLEPASRVRSPAITEARVGMIHVRCQMTPSRVTENTNGFQICGTASDLLKIAHIALTARIQYEKRRRLNSRCIAVVAV